MAKFRPDFQAGSETTTERLLRTSRVTMLPRPSLGDMRPEDTVSPCKLSGFGDG